MIDSSSTGVHQSITSYLEKPKLIQTVSWTTSQLVSAELYSFEIGNVLEANDIWMDKIKGHLNIRGKAVVTLMVNGTPYHSGMLSLRYFPCFNRLPAESYIHRRSLISKSQLPGTYMLVNKNKVAIKIPYIAPTAFKDLYDPHNYDWGKVFLDVVAPLKAGTGADTTVQIQVWLHFEDFEAVAPTVPQGIMPQGDTGGKRKIKKLNVSEREKKPISAALGHAASAATALGGIPILSSIAGPTSWFLNAASNAASAFGWSKPTDTTSLVRTTENVHYYAVNSNGIDQSQPFGVLADNKVSLLPGIGGRDVDEMSIDFIKKQWAFYTSFEWDPTQAIGTQLFNINLLPYYFKEDIAGTTLTDMKAMSPVAFLSGLFDLYRGSIKLRFTFVATQFHSGSVEARYIPGTAASTTTTANAQYIHREVLDIQKGNQFCLEMPYAQAVNYLYRGDKYGVFTLNVVNQLRAPNSAPGSVTVVVEVAGCDDLEFAIPSNFGGEVVASTGELLPQGQVDDEDDDIVCGPIAGSKVMLDNNYSSLYCIGEKVMSLLQLLKMNSRLTVTSAYVPSTTYMMDPSAISFCTDLATPGIPSMHGDWLSLIANCYAFRRGGYRVRVCSGAGGSFTVCMTDEGYDTSTIQALDNGASLGGLVNNTLKLQSPMYITKPGDCGFAAQIPYYARTPFIVNRNYSSNGTGITIENPRKNLRFQSTTADQNMILLRSVAEDFQLGFWIGVPAISITPIR